jgi:hypothetical protein
MYPDIRVIEVGRAIELADVEWDTPFRVTERRNAVHLRDGSLWTPDVYCVPDGDVEVESDRWEALTGFTGQYAYHGAILHPSEYLGGGLARHIIDNPGIYMVTEVRDEDLQYPDGDPIGWCVLRLIEED